MCESIRCYCISSRTFDFTRCLLQTQTQKQKQKQKSEVAKHTCSHEQKRKTDGKDKGEPKVGLTQRIVERISGWRGRHRPLIIGGDSWIDVDGFELRGNYGWHFDRGIDGLVDPPACSVCSSCGRAILRKRRSCTENGHSEFPRESGKPKREREQKRAQMSTCWWESHNLWTVRRSVSLNEPTGYSTQQPEHRKLPKQTLDRMHIPDTRGHIQWVTHTIETSISTQPIVHISTRRNKPNADSRSVHHHNS